MHATPVPVHGRPTETGHVPTGITDVLTIGEEATVFRPVQRTLRPTGWAVAHTENLEAAIAYLQSNVAAAAVVEAEIRGVEWERIVSCLRDLADAPEVVVVTSSELATAEVLRCGGFDLLRRPFQESDLLWAVASAWHTWMTQRESGLGGGLCSDA
jgi:ActR/RegA family two-component response regulator